MSATRSATPVRMWQIRTMSLTKKTSENKGFLRAAPQMLQRTTTCDGRENYVRRSREIASS
ncbi:hypothetical protein HYPGJ_20790 [Hyphomicrobium sp. GJ21]|nr:hypothetical protein HYPGJ_20790 [Hyphomicrobium sp. GJ21]